MSSLPKEKGEKKKESNEKPKESGEKSKESGEKPKESGEKPKESGEKPKESDEKAEEKEEEYIGYFERPKVLSRFEYGKKLELIELEGCEKVNGSILIEGFAGVGTTSTVVASYLIGERNLPLIAVFHSVELPSLCSIHKYQATSALRIYGDSTMCVCVGDIQLSAVTQSELIWTISEAVISFAHRHKCKHIISVDGFPIRSGIDRLKSMVQKAQNADSLEDQILQDDDSKQLDNLFSKVGYLSNNKQIGTQLKQLGHKAIKTGQIIGVSGALLALAFTYGQDECPLTVILAPDPVQLPDQRGALLAIKLIRQLFALDDIKVEALEEDAKRLAIKIEEAIKDAQSQISRQFQHHIRSPPPPGMYS